MGNWSGVNGIGRILLPGTPGCESARWNTLAAVGSGGTNWFPSQRHGQHVHGWLHQQRPIGSWCLRLTTTLPELVTPLCRWLITTATWLQMSTLSAIRTGNNDLSGHELPRLSCGRPRYDLSVCSPSGGIRALTTNNQVNTLTVPIAFSNQFFPPHSVADWKESRGPEAIPGPLSAFLFSKSLSVSIPRETFLLA